MPVHLRRAARDVRHGVLAGKADADGARVPAVAVRLAGGGGLDARRRVVVLEREALREPSRPAPLRHLHGHLCTGPVRAAVRGCRVARSRPGHRRPTGVAEKSSGVVVPAVRVGRAIGAKVTDGGDLSTLMVTCVVSRGAEPSFVAVHVNVTPAVSVVTVSVVAAVCSESVPIRLGDQPLTVVFVVYQPFRPLVPVDRGPRSTGGVVSQPALRRPDEQPARRETSAACRHETPRPPQSPQ